MAPPALVAQRRTAFQRVLRGVARKTFAAAMRIYFRELTFVDEPGPDVAGRMFTANHWNGIIDPIVILACAPYDASPIAKSTLFTIPGFKQLLAVGEAVPVTRRKDSPDKVGGDDATFDKVAQHLADGGNVLIFPEGVSHDSPTVLPLRSGAARMVARAHDKGARGLTLQAVALDFDARDTFRSRALVTYGPVRDVDAIAAGRQGEPVVEDLVGACTTDLHALVIEGESHGELLLVRRVAELLANDEHQPGGATLAHKDAYARGVIQRARALGRDHAQYRDVHDAVSEYDAALRASGLTDRQVARKSTSIDLRRALRSLGLALTIPPALVAAVLYFVPYKLPSLAKKMAHGEIDVVSTYKLGIGLLAFPLWMAGLLTATSLLAHGWLRVALLLGVVVSPWCALVWLDRRDDRRGARLLAGRQQLAALEALRRRALDAIGAARDP